MTLTNLKKAVGRKTKRNFNIDDVKEFINSNPEYIDDNDLNPKRESKSLIGYVILQNGYICAWLNNEFYLRGLYISDVDDKLHLAARSIGGKVDGTLDIADAINEYNDRATQKYQVVEYILY